MDADAPTLSVSIVSPLDAASLSGTVSLSASVIGNPERVEFQIDGMTVGEAPGPSYAVRFDSTTVSDGAHMITARAEAASEIATATIGVIVNNTVLGRWTEFTPSPDTSIVYVSDSAGDDSSCEAYAAIMIADPLHPDDSVVPCKTINAATAIYDDLGDEQPHWILFKSGDTWADQSLGKWNKSGRSAAEPAVLAAYGDSSERPLILTGTSSFSGAVGRQVHDVVIADVHAHAHTYVSVDGREDSAGNSGPRAFRWIAEESGSGNWTFEGLRVEGYGLAFLVGASQDPFRGMASNVTFRNNTIHGTQGENAIYISGINGTKMFEGNSFYDNGYWQNRTEGSFRGKHIYFDNENGYAGDGDPTGHAIYRDNLFVDSVNVGFQARTGGEIRGNYLEGNAIGIAVGGHDGGQVWPIVTVSIHDNVVVHLSDSLGQVLGYGIAVENADAEIENNIIAYYDSVEPFGHPFYITGNAGNTTLARLRNNTIFDTTGDIRRDGDIGALTLDNNLINDDMDLTDGNSRSSSVSFVDPDLRDLARYNSEVLGGPRERVAFMREALLQWRGFYRPEYTAESINTWVRQGFEPDGTQPEVCEQGAVMCGSAR